ncbi:hypothetical protein B0T22DRAFT_255269 [Podospora appendiculata]|uniref:Uncharacterized protein n=1 Tax=Podospora appendiculata TaxID=314037 RepID=A0AAE1C8Y9_9PEZI|nr:hypothetical protein B0T22DRAFT_255269 [Podospora appendiculata]
MHAAAGQRACPFHRPSVHLIARRKYVSVSFALLIFCSLASHPVLICGQERLKQKKKRKRFPRTFGALHLMQGLEHNLHPPGAQPSPYCSSCYNFLLFCCLLRRENNSSLQVPISASSVDGGSRAALLRCAALRCNNLPYLARGYGIASSLILFLQTPNPRRPRGRRVSPAPAPRHPTILC